MQLIILFCVFAAAIVSVSGQGIKKLKEEKMMSNDVLNRVSKMDDRTKKMVVAMQANGMPKAAIADKIKYSAGNNGVKASRMVDAITAEQKARQRR